MLTGNHCYMLASLLLLFGCVQGTGKSARHLRGYISKSLDDKCMAGIIRNPIYKQKETFCVKKIPRKIIIIYVNFSNHLIFNISSSISSSDSSNSINKSISTSKSISISKSSGSSSSNINKSISISISKSSSSIIS
ncbi:uncharacterized protein LOC112552899 [Pogonomyrmex barbatus]|uniref:Uncharacterized protein LOC112552899 n=1 Tax=Pogonomyrmex barbatus TaxID=144034 RepID=A0A8N1S8C9_9HYME|nr:uncharacterized protein LOC112552899 [Pogonomyrmex barbatus]